MEPTQSNSGSDNALTRPAAVDQLAQLAAKVLRATEAVQGALDAIAAWSELNAVAHTNAEAARHAAERVDAGEITGPLAGLPIIVKDNIQVEGLPAAAGTPGLSHAIAATNAPVVARLVDAGAIVVATTNMHELAFGISGYNPTYQSGSGVGVRNPYDSKRFAAGSSSGTGALVGAGAVAAGLGTDTGGSVRLPAAINGVAGLRPTMSRYPGEGMVPLARTRDTAGVIAASVRDIELLDSVITGDAGVGAAALDGLRLGIGAGFVTALEDDVRAVWERVVALLTERGVDLIEVDTAAHFPLNHEVSFPVCFGEAGDHLRDYLAQYVPQTTIEHVVARMASPDVRGLYEHCILTGTMPSADGSLVNTEPAYRHAIDTARPALIEAYQELFETARIEALLFPTSPAVATFATEDASAPEVFGTFIRNTDPGSNAGIPGLSVAAGLGPATGLPVGVELDGPAGSDRRLIAIGLAIEEVLGRTGLPARA